MIDIKDLQMTNTPQINSDNLIWIDLEMTGLVPEDDVIIEIATIVTDKELNVLAEGPNLAIHQPDEILDGMDEWNTRHHGDSGLTERVRNSQISAAQAEQQTIEFLRQWVPESASPMCGNTICQDRRFLARYMPELEAYFHYRHIDVSTIKELAQRWVPALVNGFDKKGSHLALDDIRESIEELAYYRQHFLRG
jgi:oligoribonuclease